MGPLAAGAQGEVAGVLPVPYDVRGGTHVVTLTGAASGGVAEAEVTINPPQATVGAAGGGEQMPMWLFVVLVSTIALALVLITTSLVMTIRRGLKHRRELRDRAANAEAIPADAPMAAAAAAPGTEPAGSLEAPYDTQPVARAHPDAPTVQLSATGADR